MSYLISRLKNRHILVGTVIAAICVVAYGGYCLGLVVQKDRYSNFLKSFKNIREGSDVYSFINPLTGGTSAAATDVGIYTDIKSDIVTYLKKEIASGDLYDYSFYFRDLNTGLWFGINESTDFFPASLFKLPIALSVYKQGEKDLLFLKKVIPYTQEIATRNSSIKENSKSILVVGKTYSVEDLVKIMLVSSDNGAKDLLLYNLDSKYVDQLFSIISLINQNSKNIYTISSIKYAYFMRILYSSSYLNEEHSELILSYLAKSTFKEGLVAGLPKGVAVAHKYGAYDFEESVNGIRTKVQQLHDCGIVYHSQKPYIFCLMTKGHDDKALYKILSHVSLMVYDYQEVNEHDDVSQ